MNRKNILIFAILIVNFMLLCMSANVQAQSQTYACDLNEDDEFIWEVKELNLHQFKRVFGFEPAFEVGDQMKKIVKNILDTSYGWAITVEEWDYGTSFERNGSISYDECLSDPEEFEDGFFLPTPVNDYLDDVSKSENLPSEYSIVGNTVERKAKEYLMTAEYDGRGVKVSETYIDDDDIVLVKVEGTFKIVPFASPEIFVGIIAFTIIGILVVMIKKKKFRIL